MLSRETIVAHGVVLAALVAFVLLLTDRGPFAWTLAGAVLAAVVIGDIVHRHSASGRERWD